MVKDKKISKHKDNNYTKTIMYDDDFDEQCRNKYYDFDKIPHILPKTDRIITFGDIHGDFDLAVKLLTVAKVINDKYEWIGGKTCVIQVGDQVDRCRPTKKGDCAKENYMKDDENSDVKILEFFYNLNKKALKKGGIIICLLGNHEINNVYGYMSYVSYKGIVEFKDEINLKSGKRIADEQNFIGNDYEVGKEVRKHLFSRGNKYAKFLACARQALVIVGSYLFVHASVVEDLATQFPNYDGIKQINVLIREWLLNIRRSEDIIKGTNLNMRDLLLNSQVSPLLPRNLGYLKSNLDHTDNECTTNLDSVYKAYNIYGIIIGHTPQFKNESGITLTCTGEVKGQKTFVARVDSGSSKAFDVVVDHNKQIQETDSESIDENREPHLLEIINDGEEIYIISTSGKKKAF